MLTVGASDRENAVAGSRAGHASSTSRHPGVEIPIATAVGKGWREGDGTSFAAPLVSGASAWVWTVRPELDATQLFEVMRRSAVDIGTPGRDDASGFGLLNVPAALAYPAPIRDPFEPNDDIEFVRPGGLYDNSIPPLTTPTKRTDTVRARLDRVEDPRDVYRVWLPKNGRVTATLTADANLDLSLWKRGTVSVTERIVGTDRLARATAPGTSERLTFVNKGPGRFAFLAVVFPKGVREATYRLRVSRAPALTSGSRGARRETAAYSTGGSSTTSGFRTRTRTAVTGKSASKRVGDRGRERLEQVIRARVGDLPDPRDDRPVVDGVLDPVAARSLLVLEVELDVDEESLSVPPLLLEHAVEAVQDDAVELDRHATRPRSIAAATGERLDVRRDVVGAEERRPPVEGRNGGADRGGGAADRPSGSPSTRASVLFRERPTSTGRPIPQIRSSPRMSARFWSGVLPKPIPGSRHTCSSGIPAATATASRSSRNAATSPTTSSYRGSTCIVRGSPCMCIRQTYAPASAMTPASVGIGPQRGDVVDERDARARAPGARPPPSTCRSRRAGPRAPRAPADPPQLLVERDRLGSRARRLAADVDERRTFGEQPLRRRHRGRGIEVVTAVREAVGRDVHDAHHRRPRPTLRERRTSHKTMEGSGVRVSSRRRALLGLAALVLLLVAVAIASTGSVPAGSGGARRPVRSLPRRG